MNAPRFRLARPLRATFALLLSATALLAGPTFASAAGTASWSLRNVAEPTVFSPNDAFTCAESLHESCDSYQLLATNIGDGASNGQITLVDELPAGVEPTAIISGQNSGSEFEELWTCEQSEVSPEKWTVTCTFQETVKLGGYAPFVSIRVSAPKQSSGALQNVAAVSGGGALSPARTAITTKISTTPPTFELGDFSVLPTAGDGSVSEAAGGHPWNFSTTFKTPSIFATPESSNSYRPQTNLKSASAELPPGFVGNPQAVGTCTPAQLAHVPEDTCPAESRVGTFALLGGGIAAGEFAYAGGVPPFEPPSAVFNMVPEHGYPAVFGFTYAHQSVFLFASVVRDVSGYHVRVISPGIPAILETDYFAIRFFGNPGAVNGSGAEPALLTNPVDCASGALGSSIEAGLWEHPSEPIFANTTAYPGVTGCDQLQFHPTLALQPAADEAGAPLSSTDSPAGLSVDLRVPQTSEFDELATPELKAATVTLPEGLVVNPSAADGRAGCKATGPQGINIGSANIGAKGQDLGDPEATELGAGHAGGDASPYDDGFYHAAPGHCPAASTLGTVVADTPLLDHPLAGQIFLGSPECAPCSSADAEGGKLLRLYLEINDPLSGTIIKLPGTVSANAATGRLVASFNENPQLPFSDLKLNFETGSRAALTSPPTCGTYSTASSLEPWSAPETPTAVSNSSFSLTSGPGGKPCATPPNAPKFEAGTTSTQAGAYAPFVLKLSREDGTQRLKALNVTLPAGLTGKLAGVQECSAVAITAAEGTGGKAEQASPSCPLASELGTVNVGAGSGPDPFYVQGHAYLAGPYKGAPLSMAIITPAVAGPFDLGTVVVRAALFVDPETARISVKSDPIPQIRAGIPLDVRSIAVNISRNQFTLNPTSCDPMTLAATVVADASEAAVSSPFQVGGCSALAFKPKLAISLKGGTRRHTFPALKAVVTYPPGSGYANIARAQVTLPHSEFLEQSHIGTVCTRVQFAAGAGNGSECPKASIYGFARATTPLLDQPLEGPVFLRSSSHELPDLVAALGGQINVDLAGRVDTGKGGGIRNTFEVVPDAPVSKFTLEMKGGSKGLLVNSEDICGPHAKTHALVHLVAQNGKVLDLKPKIANSCGKKHGKKSKGKGKKKASGRVGSSHR